MDWFQRWPKEALIAVADHFLSQYDIVCSEEVKKQVIQTMGIVHDGVAECCVEYFQRYLRTNFYVTSNRPSCCSLFNYSCFKRLREYM